MNKKKLPTRDRENALGYRIRSNIELVNKYNIPFIEKERNIYHFKIRDLTVIFYLNDGSWRVKDGGVNGGGIKKRGFNSLLVFLELTPSRKILKLN